MNKPLPDHQLLRTPAGEELVVLTRKAFDDLVNARNHVLSREDVIVDRVETLRPRRPLRLSPPHLTSWIDSNVRRPCAAAAMITLGSAGVVAPSGGGGRWG
jgi:hypothetical protein